MEKEFYAHNRATLASKLQDNSVTILFSGEYPFVANRNFYYLTGIEQENVVLVLYKKDNSCKEYLFLKENDPLMVKWVGPTLYPEEAAAISGIKDVRYLKSFSNFIYALFNFTRVQVGGADVLYLDLERSGEDPKAVYPGVKFSRSFKKSYPEIKIINIYPEIIRMRMYKQAPEIAKMRESIAVTKEGLDAIMRHLHPQMYEYQVEAAFDYAIKCHGNKKKAFATICASGKNATVLHYSNNSALIPDNALVLFDLGCETEHYAADISRTYPASGKFTKREREVYAEVLACNKKCIAYLKSGISWQEYNAFANNLLTESLKKLGKIKAASELSKYYWHAIGHSLGLDTHDPALMGDKITSGMVVTVEPGLYLEDEGIGVRIEDDVLIKDDGCEVLSKDIIKEADAIEAYMNKVYK